jgi:sugar phosphate isomerase/epimerase
VSPATGSSVGTVATRRHIPVALSTASAYPESLQSSFSLAADLGYDGIELMVWTDRVSQDVRIVSQLAERYSLPVLAVHSPCLLITQRVWSPDPAERLRRSVVMARQLGAGTVVVHPPFRWQRLYATGFVDLVRELHGQDGVTVAVENMFPWRVRGREIAAYAPHWDPVAGDYDAVTLDLSHTATAGSDALAMARALGPRLTHVHLADGSGSARDEHLIPGRGNQPCGELLDGLPGSGFAGTVVLEVSTRKSRSHSQREYELADALAFARLHLT